jgi:hypothetical protein
MDAGIGPGPNDGRSPMTSNATTSISIDDRVEAGAPGTEDYDTGTVFEIDGDKAFISWDSGAACWTPISILSVLDREDDPRFQR